MLEVVVITIGSIFGIVLGVATMHSIFRVKREEFMKKKRPYDPYWDEASSWDIDSPGYVYRPLLLPETDKHC